MPSGATSMRRGRASRFGISNSFIAPVLALTRPSLFVPKSAIQIEPSGASLMPYGSERGVGQVNTRTFPVAGSSSPYVLFVCAVNQTLLPTSSGVCGALAFAGSLNSVIFIVRGSRCPISPARCAVYQTERSGATTMPCGPDFGVGVGTSVILPVAGSRRPMKLFA